MSKRIKRTLAILLVVCALFGLVAVPAAANDGETTETTPKTYVYDFRDLSQLKTAAEGAEPMWKFSADSVDAPKYGFGNQRLDKKNSNAWYWMNDFYTQGWRNGGTTAKPVIYYKDLNWRVVEVTDDSTQTVHTSTATMDNKTMNTADMDRVYVGGYYQGDESKKHSFSGIRHTGYTVVIGKFDDGEERRSAKETPGHWVAINIKAPEIGTYTVTLDHLQTKYGSQAGSVYVIPGAISDRDAINAYISDDTYKLEASVDYFEEINTIKASENKLLGLPESNDEMALAATTTLGTVDISEPVEEYTLVFKADKNRGGSTSADCARQYLESLTFTQQEEVPVVLDLDTVEYDFNRSVNGVATTLAGLAGKYYTDGTTDGSDGGYPLNKATVGTSKTFTVTNSATQKTSTLSTVAANVYYLSYYNVFKADSTGSSVYYHRDINITDKTVTIDSTSRVVNQAGQNALKAKYEDANDSLNWQILGSDISSAYYLLGGKYLQVYGISDDHYVATMIHAPGEGRYEVDLQIYQYGASKYATSGHMGMKVYIVEAPEGIAPAADYVYTATLGTPDAIYRPDFQARAAQETGVAAPLVKYYEGYDKTTDNDESFTYDFEAGKDYIVILQRDSNTTPKGDNNKYAPNNIYLEKIIAKPGYATKATVNEDYAPGEISLGYSDSSPIYKAMYAKAKDTTGTWYTDGTFVPNELADGETAPTPAEGAVAITDKNMRNYYFNAHANASNIAQSTSLSGYKIINKVLQDAQKANYEAHGWRDLGHTNSLGAIRHDNNQVLYDCSTSNTYAALVKSPGTGKYTVSVRMRTGSPATYTETVDGETVTKYYNYAPLWQNIRIVKVEGDVTPENYADYYKQNKNSMLVGEYTPDWMQPTQDSKGAYVATTYDWMNLKEKNTDGMVDFTIDLEAGADYIVYYELHERADYLKVDKDPDNYNYSGTTAYNYGLRFDCVNEPTTKVEYTTLSAAIADAKPGETIKLQQDALLNEVDIITEGVTLDLNGHTLSATAVGPTGKLVGNGVLKTYASTNVNAELMAENTLPLYDASVKGYKLFKYSYLNAQTEEVGNDTVTFWYQLLFEDAAAYDIIESGTSGFTMGIDLTADDVYAPCIFKNSKQTGEEIVNDANAWAAAYATFAKATLAKDKTPWLYVNVTNAAMADAISVAPVITTGNADYKLAAINYGLKEDK